MYYSTRHINGSYERMVTSTSCVVTQEIPVLYCKMMSNMEVSKRWLFVWHLNPPSPRIDSTLYTEKQMWSHPTHIVQSSRRNPHDRIVANNPRLLRGSIKMIPHWPHSYSPISYFKWHPHQVRHLRRHCIRYEGTLQLQLKIEIPSHGRNEPNCDCTELKCLELLSLTSSLIWLRHVVLPQASFATSILSKQDRINQETYAIFHYISILWFIVFVWPLALRWF